MLLILIRHGRPEWHVPFSSSLAQFERLSAGYDATHLSEEGAKAMDALARRLPPYCLLCTFAGAGRSSVAR